MLLFLLAGVNAQYRWVCVSGGIGSLSDALNSTECFNSSTNTWALQPSLTLPWVNMGGSAVNLGEVACLIGGADLIFNPNPVLCTNGTEWVSLPAIGPGRFSTVTLYGGGWIGGAQAGQGWTTSTVVYGSGSYADPNVLSFDWIARNTIFPPGAGNPFPFPFNQSMCVGGGSGLNTYCLEGDLTALKSGNLTLAGSWVPGPPLSGGPRDKATLINADMNGWCVIGGEITNNPVNSVDCLDSNGFHVGDPFPVELSASVNLSYSRENCLVGGSTVTGVEAKSWCVNTTPTGVQYVQAASLNIARQLHLAYEFFQPPPIPTTPPTLAPTFSPTPTSVCFLVFDSASLSTWPWFNATCDASVVFDLTPTPISKSSLLYDGESMVLPCGIRMFTIIPVNTSTSFTQYINVTCPLPPVDAYISAGYQSIIQESCEVMLQKIFADTELLAKNPLSASPTDTDMQNRLHVRLHLLRILVAASHTNDCVGLLSNQLALAIGIVLSVPSEVVIPEVLTIFNNASLDAKGATIVKPYIVALLKSYITKTIGNATYIINGTSTNSLAQAAQQLNAIEDLMQAVLALTAVNVASNSSTFSVGGNEIVVTRSSPRNLQNSTVQTSSGSVTFPISTPIGGTVGYVDCVVVIAPSTPATAFTVTGSSCELGATLLALSCFGPDNSPVNISNLPANDPLRITVPHRILGTEEASKCVFWEPQTQSLSGSGCVVDSTARTDNTTVCLCQHATIFAVQFFPAPNLLHTQDFSQLNSANIRAHPVPLVVVMVMIAVFLFMGVLAGLRDKRDQDRELRDLKLARRAEGQGGPVSLAKAWWISMRDQHLWISVVLRRLGDPYSSKQRLCCLAANVFLIFMLNGIFFTSTRSTFSRAGSSFLTALLSNLTLPLTRLFRLAAYMGLPSNYMLTLQSDETQPKRILARKFLLFAYAVALAEVATCAILIIAFGLQFDRGVMACVSPPEASACFCTQTALIRDKYSRDWLSRCGLSLLIDIALVAPVRVLFFTVLRRCFARKHLPAKQAQTELSLVPTS